MKIVLLLILLLPLPVIAACISCHDEPEHYATMSCTGCHGGIDNTSREDLAHYKLMRGQYASFMWKSVPVQEGERMIKKYSCRRCHRIDGTGSSLASNLDVSVQRLTPEEIELAIEQPNEQMPDFRLSKRERVQLVNAILHFSRTNPASGMVEVVHFGGGVDTDIYQTKCGGCHRLLSRMGALGTRSLAPFLSGINTEHYPPLDNVTWTRKRLSDWIDNPRSLKNFATMPIVELKPAEKEAIMDIIWGE